MKAVDGGLACNACKNLCAKKSGSNPGISFWSIGVSVSKCALNLAQERL
jgi:hypothetical protein